MHRIRERLIDFAVKVASQVLDYRSHSICLCHRPRVGRSYCLDKIAGLLCLEAQLKSVLQLYREVVATFPKGGPASLRLYSWLLASLAVLDALALGLLAVVIGPIAAGKQLVLPWLGTVNSIGIIWLIVVICVLMMLKSALAVFLTWWATRRIPKYEIAIGDRLFRSFITAPWRDRLRKNSADVMRFSDTGVDQAVNSFVLPGATLLGEFFTLGIVIATLAIVQPIIAFTTLLYLLVIGVVLFFWVARRARKAGDIHVENTIAVSRLVLEVIGAMKEVSLRNKELEVASVVERTRSKSATARGDLYFLSQVPRYALEAGLILGFLLIGGIGFLLGGIEQAISAVALFALAGFRVAPSIIRVQSVLALMVSITEFPRRMLSELRESETASKTASERPDLNLPKSPASLVFRNVSFAYSGSASKAIKNVSLEIPFGSFVAFVGSSGSGKSTMIDLVLSLLEPTSGRIEIDGLDLNEVRSSWRTRVGYVPQDVAIFDATIAQNVALTWGSSFDPERVEESLRRAQLWDFVKAKPESIDSRVGERGLALSGGQRQRLGIARALYSDPLVLVLDEATSALDTDTEAKVTKGIDQLGSGLTRIVVAHRLATIRHADQIYFMRDGEISGHGTFRELVNEIPEFAHQANLAGLN